MIYALPSLPVKRNRSMCARAQTPGTQPPILRAESATWVSSNSKTCGLRPRAHRGPAQLAAAHGPPAAARPARAVPRHDRRRPVVLQRHRHDPTAGSRPNRVKARVSQPRHLMEDVRRHRKGHRPRHRMEDDPRHRQGRRPPGRRPIVPPPTGRASISTAFLRRSSKACRRSSKALTSCNRCRDSSRGSRVSSLAGRHRLAQWPATYHRRGAAGP